MLYLVLSLLGFALLLAGFILVMGIINAHTEVIGFIRVVSMQ